MLPLNTSIWKICSSEATKKQNKLTLAFSPLPYMITQKKDSMLIAQHGQNNITHNSSHFRPIKVLSPTFLEGEDDDENDRTEFERHCHPAHMSSSAETSTDTLLTSSLISTPLFGLKTSSPTNPGSVPRQHSRPQCQNHPTNLPKRL